MWVDEMCVEMSSMRTNDVWELSELPNGHKVVGCKWVFKTKKDSNGNIECFNTRLVAKGFSQQQRDDNNKTFLPVSSKDSFRFIMALIAHFFS